MFIYIYIFVHMPREDDGSVALGRGTPPENSSGELRITTYDRTTQSDRSDTRQTTKDRRQREQTAPLQREQQTDTGQTDRREEGEREPQKGERSTHPTSPRAPLGSKIRRQDQSRAAAPANSRPDS